MTEVIRFALLYIAGIAMSGLGICLTVNGILLILRGLKVIT